jgi:hypothetical protein
MSLAYLEIWNFFVYSSSSLFITHNWATKGAWVRTSYLNVDPIYGAQLEAKLNLLEGTRISLNQYNFFLVTVGLALLTYVRTFENWSVQQHKKHFSWYTWRQIGGTFMPCKSASTNFLVYLEGTLHLRIYCKSEEGSYTYYLGTSGILHLLLKNKRDLTPSP